MPRQCNEQFSAINLFFDTMTKKEAEDFLNRIVEDLKCRKLISNKKNVELEERLRIFLSLKSQTNIDAIAAILIVLRVRLSDYRFRKCLKRLGVSKKKVQLVLDYGTELVMAIAARGGNLWATL